jgi:hypothetical protein
MGEVTERILDRAKDHFLISSGEVSCTPQMIAACQISYGPITTKRSRWMESMPTARRTNSTTVYNVRTN